MARPAPPITESFQPPATARVTPAAPDGPSRSVRFIGQLQGSSESDDSLPDFADVRLTSTPAPARSHSRSQHQPLPCINLPALPPITSLPQVIPAISSAPSTSPDMSDLELIALELGLDNGRGRGRGSARGRGQGRAARRGGCGRGVRNEGDDVGLVDAVQPAQSTRRSSRLNLS